MHSFLHGEAPPGPGGAAQAGGGRCCSLPGAQRPGLARPGVQPRWGAAGHPPGIYTVTPIRFVSFTKYNTDGTNAAVGFTPERRRGAGGAAQGLLTCDVWGWGSARSSAHPVHQRLDAWTPRSQRSEESWPCPPLPVP